MGPRNLAIRSDFHPAVAGDELRQQFENPSDVFSILLLVGPDIIAQALAQSVGGLITPVTFSFGWVAYGVSALVAAGGENKLMPSATDSSSIVINGSNGHVRDNSSWVIGRIIRDFGKWMHPKTRLRVEQNKRDKLQYLKEKAKRNHQDPDCVLEPSQAGLCVTVYKPSASAVAGKPRPDIIHYSGIATAVFQLSIAAIPCGFFGDWGTLMITACGMVLCLITGALPQWRREKWACRKNTDKSFVLTRGNGSQHAIVVLGNGLGLDFEDLAASSQNTEYASFYTRLVVVILAVAWVLLLIAATGLRRHAWFLLAVGGVGMVQNMLAAGIERSPSALGVHLDFVEAIGHHRVMETLFEIEEKYPGLGASMRATFFPGKINKEHETRWEAYESTQTLP